jgi:hypothetical protein
LVFVKPLEYCASLSSLTSLTFVAHVQKLLTPDEVKSSGNFKKCRRQKTEGWNWRAIKNAFV